MGSKRRPEERMQVVIRGDLDARELEVLRLQIERLARDLGAEVTAWRVEDAGR